MEKAEGDLSLPRRFEETDIAQGLQPADRRPARVSMTVTLAPVLPSVSKIFI